MTSGLTLVLIVVAAYLAAHIAFEWLARRFLVVSGAEYLLLGILLGPLFADAMSTSVVDGFAPVMTLALGWIGAAIGAQFYLPRLIKIPAVTFRVAFVEALLTLTVVTAVSVAVLMNVFELRLERVILPSLTLGAIATASAGSGIAVAAQRLGRRGPVVRQLQVANAIDGLVAITTFGLLLCFAHAPPVSTVRPPTPTEWAVISIGIGCVGGALFHLFLVRERHIDRLFIGLAGAIILASGAAAYLRLSPLLPTLLIGAILINTSPNREEIQQVLERVGRPLYFVLLIFAGAAWRPSSYSWWVVPVLAFLAARYVAKTGGARIAARLDGLLPALGPDWGRALLGQGPLAMAIALNYLLHDNSLLPNIVFTAAVASVLLTDILSARLVHSALQDQLRRQSARLLRHLPHRRPEA